MPGSLQHVPIGTPSLPNSMGSKKRSSPFDFGRHSVCLTFSDLHQQPDLEEDGPADGAADILALACSDSLLVSFITSDVWSRLERRLVLRSAREPPT
eukprot:CAMPEP_0172836312 /NCGR_PEP_ID=MMETSP1075-20121228/26402_1 /TAXON_ID=2916 /ORGANISM="Ceratium fusus, Strain PA161109" /LENGTH=96 /DNA_ID=CAMNT_0013679525 /DNA_START=417 /DNA_END=704 /DNA_ORIENTATION=-